MIDRCADYAPGLLQVPAAGRPEPAPMAMDARLLNRRSSYKNVFAKNEYSWRKWQDLNLRALAGLCLSKTVRSAAPPRFPVHDIRAPPRYPWPLQSKHVSQRAAPEGTATLALGYAESADYGALTVSNDVKQPIRLPTQDLDVAGIGIPKR